MTIPILVGDELLVNTTIAGDQFEPAMAALTDGRFVVVWMDLSLSDDDTDGYAVRGRIFNADGSKVGTEFLVNTTVTDSQQYPSVTGLANGGFVVAWESAATDADILAQVFDAMGTQVGTEFQVNTTEAQGGELNNPTLATLADGRFIAVWNEWLYRNSDDANYNLKAQIFNADGSPSGSEFKVNTSSVDTNYPPTVTSLSGGGFVIAWTDSWDLSGDPYESVHAQVFDAYTNKVGGEILVNTITTEEQDWPTITALANDRFVVAWRDSSGTEDPSRGVYGQVFNSDGSKAGDDFLVNTTTAGYQGEPAITALPDGRFVVTWLSDGAGGDTSGDAIRAQVFNSDGTKSGEEFLVNTTLTGDQVEPAITALSDGRIVIAWTDEGASEGDTSGGAIRAQIFDPRTAMEYTGTDGDDDFVGTPGDDTLWGGPGNDTLDGAGGKDEVHGQAGDDALYGGEGDDTLEGGDGTDLLDGGPGADSLVGGAGGDTYIVDNAGDVVSEAVVALGTQRISTDSAGNQTEPNRASNMGKFSPDGRYVVFESMASNLVENDANTTRDLFVKDLQTGEVQRVSTSSAGGEANEFSYNAEFSADGRYLVFSSYASNLVEGDTNTTSDVFVKDLQTGTVQRVSTDSNGNQANKHSDQGGFSPDGRYVVFQSTASNLVENDTNGHLDTFVKDLQTGAVQRISVNEFGTEGNDNSYSGTFSPDGRYVAFGSTASNFLDGDDISWDYWIKDLQTGAIQCATTDANGVKGDGGTGGPAPLFTSNGRHLIFQSGATNLVPGDTNGESDIFKKDLVTGAIERLSTDSSGQQAFGFSAFPDLSADDRYLVFYSTAPNLVAGDTNGAADVFAKDLVTGEIRLVSTDSNGVVGNTDSVIARLSADGRYIVFQSYASNLVAGDTNGDEDVFLVANPFLSQDDGAIDTVQSSITYTLPDAVENLTLTGTDTIHGMGNALDNLLIGNAVGNVLNGLEGDDTLQGMGGNDTLKGSLGQDSLAGGNGNDTLDGESGADTMAGNAGNDTYFVNDAGDVVTEAADAGWADHVKSFITYTLPVNVEKLTLLGTAALDGSGNELANTLFGNSGNNQLWGLDGNDTLQGNAGNDYVRGGNGNDLLVGYIGNDTLDGGTGNDSLHGGDGADSLVGGTGVDTLEGAGGDDRYSVDSSGDIVIEVADGGIDTVISSISYNLSDTDGAGSNGGHVENLILTGNSAVVGTGNDLNNQITGNALNNLLNGGKGGDVLNGGVGNDTLYGGADVDVLFGGVGDDLYIIQDGGDLIVELNGVDPTLVSASASGVQGNGFSHNASFSPDGGKVVFESAASNLVTGDTNIQADIFVKDLNTGGIERITTNALGEAANGESLFAQFSPDGGSILFQSKAGNLVAGDTNGQTDVFIKHLSSGEVERVSTSDYGDQAVGGDSFQARFSPDGRYVSFESDGLYLEGNIDYGYSHVYAKDLVTGQLQRASTNFTGLAGNDASMDGVFSPDGQYLMFTSLASDLVLGDTNNTADIFIKDLNYGITQRVSSAVDGTQGNGFSKNARFSPDGRQVVFESQANNLVTGDTNGQNDLFIKDLETGPIQRVSTGVNGQANGASGQAQFSADGHYLLFESTASNLVLGDTNNAKDIFIKDLRNGAIQRISLDAEGNQANQQSLSASFSADGRYVVFSSKATNLVASDGNGTTDVFRVLNPFLMSGCGYDTVQSSVDFSLPDNVEKLILMGRAGIKGTGNALNNVIIGNTGGNTLDGQGGADTLRGGVGNDIYVVDHIGDRVWEGLDHGLDTVKSSISYVLTANVESLTLTGSAAISGSGNASNNTLTGNAANNAMDGKGGDDTLYGGDGNDSLLGGDGQDSLSGGNGNDLLRGQNGNDILYGGNGSDFLHGEAGNDSMVGGAGNDYYLVEQELDRVSETVDAGNDTVESFIAYSLVDTDGDESNGGNVENLRLLGSANIDGTGNALNNLVTGNSGDNWLRGGNGNDTLEGEAGDDTLDGGDGTNTVSYANATAGIVASLKDHQATGMGNDVLHDFNHMRGSSFADTLIGNNGINMITGGLGADLMVGLGGNDAYLVDDAQDRILEYQNGGRDGVFASVSYFLGDHVEDLTLTGSSNLVGVGNDLDNLLTGNAGSNILDGSGGSDTVSYATATTAVSVDLSQGTATLPGQDILLNIENLIGSAFNDTLMGDSGHNVLDGGAGADQLSGGGGNDTFIIENIGDTITPEALDSSVDTVISTVSHTLVGGMENLILLGEAAINGAGNALDNILTGNAANNALDGREGIDTADFSNASGAVICHIPADHKAADETGGGVI